MISPLRLYTPFDEPVRLMYAGAPVPIALPSCDSDMEAMVNRDVNRPFAGAPP